MTPAAALCLGFNRPDLLAQVLEAIGSAGPRELFVSIDGPRAGHPDDPRLIADVKAVARDAAWPTRLHLRTPDENLGVSDAVTSAISWAFDHVEELIILEDDCLPDPSFLRFCDQLLERYRDDERVMQISGTNWGAAEHRFNGYSYGFTSFAPIWGWATWRRAWALNDRGLRSWPRFRDSGMAEGMAISPRFRRLLSPDWDKAHAGEGLWDFEWQYSVLRHHGLNLCPARNLVVNIGFRPDATHQVEPDLLFSNLALETLDQPLIHPPEVALNPSVQSVFGRVYWQKMALPAQAFRRLVRNRRLNRIIRTAVRRVYPHRS